MEDRLKRVSEKREHNMRHFLDFQIALTHLIGEAEARVGDPTKENRPLACVSVHGDQWWETGRLYIPLRPRPLRPRPESRPKSREERMREAKGGGKDSVERAQESSTFSPKSGGLPVRHSPSSCQPANEQHVSGYMCMAGA